MSDQHSSNHTNHHHPQVGHVVSMKILVGVWLALMALTYLTVAATWVDLGSFNLIVAILIATVKASLVVLFFMHLLYDHPFNGFIFIVSLFFVGLFIVLAMLDSAEYKPHMIEGYAPKINR